MQYCKLSAQQVRALLPVRNPQTHKGDYGRLLLLCGSLGYTGAAALAAMGALRSGSGLVYLGVPECIYAIEAVKLTESIVFPLPCVDGMLSVDAVAPISKRLPQMDGVLIGPGLGCNESTRMVTRSVLENYDGPVVLDADGINVLAGHMDILRGRTAPTILTPHLGEFRRIAGACASEKDAAAFAKEYGIILVLKSYETIITDGQTAFRNSTGNPGMAVGGSGDVLAGILIGLIGQGLPALQAAACAVWLHGAAGDLCAEEIGQYGMLPTDLLDVLPRLLP